MWSGDCISFYDFVGEFYPFENPICRFQMLEKFIFLW